MARIWISLFSRLQTHKLTEQEEAEARECFALFDRDHDGRIAISELGLIMRSLGRAPTQLEVKEYEKMINKGTPHAPVADGTGNDTFDINGLFEVLTKSWKSLQEEEEAILNAFRVFDKENTGKIDAEELRHIFVTLGDTLTQEEVQPSRSQLSLFFVRLAMQFVLLPPVSSWTLADCRR